MYRIYLDHFALLFSSPLRSFPCGWRRIWQERLVCPRLRIAFPTIAKLHRNLALKPSRRHCIQLERLSDRFIDFLFLSCRAGPYPSLFGTASRVALATSVLSARGYRNNLCLEVRSVSRPPTILQGSEWLHEPSGEFLEMVALRTSSMQVSRIEWRWLQA